jgi:hypothetical protein
MAEKEKLILHLKKLIFQNLLLYINKPLGTGRSARVKVLKWAVTFYSLGLPIVTLPKNYLQHPHYGYVSEKEEQPFSSSAF